MAFTSSQWKALAIIPHFSSFLSMMGDAWIVYDILWHRKRVKKLVVHSYHRILLMMSIWDFIVISFGKFLASWAMPENTPNVWYAAGTQQTCTMQGFSIQFSLIVPMYNAMVALYYLLVIRFGLSNEVIEKKYERWMHICPFVISLAFAITGLVPSMQLYAPSTMWCWMNSVPKGCIQSYEGKGPTTCTRGDNSYIYRLAFYYAPIWLCIAFTATSMIIIYRSMKSQETKTKRYKYTAGTSGDNNERPMARSSLFGSLRGTANKSKITTKVATQSYFYVGGFLMVWTFPTINRILGFFNKKYFPLTVLHAIFSPLQGFVNFVVYIRPRLITFIKEQKKRTDGKRSTCSLLRDFFLFMETATDEGYMRDTFASRTSAMQASVAGAEASGAERAPKEEETKEEEKVDV